MPDADFFSLSGKVAVVTGGAQGIGAAIVRRLLAAGARVQVVDLQDCATDVAAWGASFLQADISQDDSMASILDHAMSVHGRLDILVNNAAIADRHPLLDADLERAARYFRVNAVSVLSGIAEAARRMEAGGSIINLASLAAGRATPGWGEYAMSKGAVVSITQTAAMELGPSGIRVNAICPGGILTPASREVNAGALQRALQTLSPLGRIGRPEEIAAMAHFLASDDASYVTGQAYFVDGGWSLGTTVSTFQMAAENA